MMLYNLEFGRLITYVNKQKIKIKEENLKRCSFTKSCVFVTFVQLQFTFKKLKNLKFLIFLKVNWN